MGAIESQNEFGGRVVAWGFGEGGGAAADHQHLDVRFRSWKALLVPTTTLKAPTTTADMTFRGTIYKLRSSLEFVWKVNEEKCDPRGDSGQL